LVDLGYNLKYDFSLERVVAYLENLKYLKVSGEFFCAWKSLGEPGIFYLLLEMVL